MAYVSGGGVTSWLSTPGGAGANAIGQSFSQFTAMADAPDGYIYIHSGLIERVFNAIKNLTYNDIPQDDDPNYNPYGNVNMRPYLGPYLVSGSGTGDVYASVLENHLGDLTFKDDLSVTYDSIEDAISSFDPQSIGGTALSASALSLFGNYNLTSLYDGIQAPAIESSVESTVESELGWLTGDDAVNGRPLYDSKEAMDFIINEAAILARGYETVTSSYIENDATPTESDSDISTLVTTGRTAVTNENAGASALVDMGDWNTDSLADANSNITSAAEAVITLLNGNNTTKVLNTITTAVVAGNYLLTDNTYVALLDEMQTAFAAAILNDHMRASNRLAGLFVEGNAVNTSTFIIANTMLESDHLQRLADYRAKLEFDTFNKAFDAYVQSWNQTATSYLSFFQSIMGQEAQVYLQNMGYKTELAKTVSTLAVQYHTERLRERFDTYHKHLGALTDVEKQTYAEGGQTFRTMFDSYLRSYVAHDMRYKDRKHEALMAKSSEGVKAYVDKVQMNALLFDANKQWHSTYITAMEESTDRAETFFNKKNAWYSDQWLKFGQALAVGAGGMVGPAPETKPASSLAGGVSGLLSGAGAGAGLATSLVTAGAVNSWNPVGWTLMGAGAIAGLVGGLSD